MGRLHKAQRAARLALAAGSAGFGVFLLVRAWDAPLDGGSALFTPLAFVGAALCFGLSVVLLVRQDTVPRKGRPAAR